MGVDGHSGCLEPVALLERAEVRALRESAQEDHVRGVLISQGGARGGDPAIEKSGRRGGLGRGRPNRVGKNAGLLRVGIAKLVGQALSAEDGDGAVLALGLEEDAEPRHLDAAQLGHEPTVRLGRDAAGATVGHAPRAVDRREVDPCGDVVRLHWEIDAERRQDAAADQRVDRVVPEERKVAGSAAGRDPSADRLGEPADRLGGQAVQVRRPCHLQLGLAGGLLGQAAQAVDHEQDDLARRLKRQLREELRRDGAWAQ